jgi:nucleoside-diphosphate-sugar epimerase
VKRVFITGSTGSIGIALIEYCIEQGVEAYAMCRRHSRRIDRIPNDRLVHVLECDLGDMKDFDVSSLPNIDAFYHLGWDATIGDGRNDTNLQLLNVRYTLDAVDLAARLNSGTFIGAGSQAEYGRFDGKLSGNVPTFPETGYGIAKLCAGQMSRLECNKRGIKHIWTRILSIYGPNDSDKTMIYNIVNKLLNDEDMALTKGEQMWDYLYCGDAARALLLLGEKGVGGKIYCIGSGNAKPLADYIKTIVELIPSKGKIGIGEMPYSDKQVMYLCADISDLTYDTGFVPEISFEEGIKNTIDWMKERIQNEEN